MLRSQPVNFLVAGRVQGYQPVNLLVAHRVQGYQPVNFLVAGRVQGEGIATLQALVSLPVHVQVRSLNPGLPYKSRLAKTGFFFFQPPNPPDSCLKYFTKQ